VLHVLGSRDFSPAGAGPEIPANEAIDEVFHNNAKARMVLQP
jgi:hypothetical protein